MLIMKSNLLGGATAKLQPKTTSPVTEVSPTKATTPTPVPEIDRKSINVKVLNGTGTAGQATEVKDILKEAGYIDILTGNADNFEYKTTEIQVKKSNPELGTTMKTDLKAHVVSPKITTLDEDSAADVIIIFGADFK
jgi:hypothetical protein